MKPVTVSLMFALLAATATAGVADLVTALSDANGETRLAAIEGIAPGQYAADAIGPVAGLLDNENPAIAGDARVALERIVGPLTKDASGRASASAALCEALTNLESSMGRRWVSWIISYAGGEEEVAPLAALLD